MHLYIIGRGYGMRALEYLIKMLRHAGAVFMTMEDAVAEARSRMFS
jgi:hypothetical protein